MATNSTVTESNFTYGHCLSSDALGGSGVSLSVQDAFIEPAPGPDYTLEVFDSAGASVVVWGAGTLYDDTLGHFPANTATTYPMVSGEYYTVLTTPSDSSRGCCFPVQSLALCNRTGPVVIEFEGLSDNVSLDFQVEVGTLTTLSSAFTPLTVADQFQVFDDSNALIYDSGLVTGSQIEQDIDLTTLDAGGASDISSGLVRIVITSGGAAGTTTLFSLALGCCLPEPCEQPLHDPLPYLVYTSDGCSFGGTVRTNNWYKNAVISNSMGYSLVGTDPKQLDPPEGSPCSNNRYVTERNTNLFNFGAGCDSELTSETFACLGHGLAADRTVTDTGTSIVMEYATNASYLEAEATFQQFETWAQAHLTSNSLNEPWVIVQSLPGDNSTNPCSSDVAGTGSFRFYWQAGYLVYNSTGGGSGNGSITYTPTVIAENPLNCCSSVVQPYTLALQRSRFLEFVTSSESWRNSMTFSTVQNGPASTGPTPDANGVVTQSVTGMGLSSSSCQTFQGLNDYNYRFNVSDPVGTFEMWRGPLDTGVQLIDGMPWYTGTGTDGNGFDSRAGGFQHIYLQAANGPSKGWVLQEIDYNTATFDLSYFSGGNAESFVDGAAMATRLSTLSGFTVTHIPVFNLFWISSSLGEIVQIPTTV